MATIYLDRNNSIARRLTVDGAIVQDSTITRAIFYMPGAAVNGDDVIFDSLSDADIVLAENDTAVKILGGMRSLKTGRYRCKLTCFDGASPQGLAWDQFTVTVIEWPPEV